MIPYPCADGGTPTRMHPYIPAYTFAVIMPIVMAMNCDDLDHRADDVPHTGIIRVECFGGGLRPLDVTIAVPQMTPRWRGITAMMCSHKGIMGFARMY